MPTPSTRSSANGLQVAVFGASHGHAKLYLPALAADQRIGSVVLSDPDTGALAGYRSLSCVTAVFTDDREMLAKTRPDVIFVLGRHCDMATAAERALEVGVPVVLEKPGGLTVDEVVDVQTLARERDIPVFVPFVQRFGPLPAAFETAGRIQHASLQFLAGPASRYRDHGMPWILDRESAGAGVLFNLAVHFVDMFLWKVARHDPPTAIEGQLARFDPHLEIDDFARLTITTRSQATVTLEASYTYPSSTGRYTSYVVKGTDALIAIDRHGRGEKATTDGVTPFSVDVDSDNYYRPWANRLVDVLTGTRDNVSADELATIDDLVEVRLVTDAVLAEAAY